MMTNINLSDEQREVVESTDKHILCLAGAGSGKTHTLIERVKYLVFEKYVDPESILVLTFTNAAAFEMYSRFEKSSGTLEKRPQFRTFHSFCYSLIVSDVRIRRLLGYQDVPSIVDEYAYKRIVNTAKLQCNIKLSAGKLSGKNLLTEKEAFDYQTFRKALYRLMVKENVISFDRLCQGVCELFEHDDTSISQYKDKYRYIFVDEFQDTDRYQWNFVNSFSNSNIFLVADALQAIYAFRGADSSIVKDIAEDSDYQVYKLTYNFRSTQEICDYANSISDYANDSYRIILESSRSGAGVEFRDLDSGFQVRPGDYVSDLQLFEIRDIVEELSGTTAILCRTNAEVIELQLELRELMNRDSEELVEYKPLKLHFYSIIRSTQDPRYFLDWIASYLDYDSYMVYIRDRSNYIREDYCDETIYTLDFWREFNRKYHVKDPYTSARCVNSTINIVSNVNSDTVSTWSYILDEFGIVIEDAELDTSSYDAYIQSIQNIIDNPERNFEDLYIGTIHSSKGLEYDNVILINVGGTTFRLSNEENNNLYYVGVTRAKNRLYVWRA